MKMIQRTYRAYPQEHALIEKNYKKTKVKKEGKGRWMVRAMIHYENKLNN